MIRPALAVAALGTAAALAACGTAASTTTPTGRGGQFARNRVAGELVKIDGATLTVSTQAGDVTVGVTSSTMFSKVSTGSLGDVVAGDCMVASGQKDGTGTLTVSTVRIFPAQNGTCSLRGPGGGSPNPSESAFPRPSGFGGNGGAFTAGKVTAVSGTSVTLQTLAGASETITVPTTVSVVESAAATESDLATGDCVTASGTKDASGNIAQARSVSIVPAGPSGCGSGGRGFGGGFGGGDGSGGGGGGFGGPPGG